MRDNLETYKNFVKPFYAARDIAHNFNHIQRIIQRLEILSQEVTPSLKSDHLYFLACFHGLGARINDDEIFRQHVVKFLKDIGWEGDEVSELFKSLERHLELPATIEEQIVHDANKVDILGAFGVAKAFTMGAILGQTYEETVEYFEHKTLGKTVFYTPIAKRLAKEGQEYALKFLERLKQELEIR